MHTCAVGGLAQSENIKSYLLSSFEFVTVR